jgi:hypothetical protein
MLRKLISAIIYGHLVYVAQSSANNVTFEKVLDLSVFGTCNVYLKRFRDDQVTFDLTEKIIVVQQKLRVYYALTAIDNSTRVMPMASPTVSRFERCVLNVIVGIAHSDKDRLAYFMFYNKFTYSSSPFSTYILLPETLEAKGNLLYPYLAILILPVRVFYLFLTTVPQEYTRPYVLICAHCGESSWAKAISANSDLAYISSYNFSSSWVRNDVQTVNPNFNGEYPITGCQNGPWRDYSGLYGSSKMSICNYYFAFMDVLVSSIDSNLTASAKYTIKPLENRYAGVLMKMAFKKPEFDFAASSWFVDVGVGKLYFCDCHQKSQKEILRAWTAPFRRSVWLCLIITFLLLSLAIGAKLYIGMEFANKEYRANDFAAPLMAVAGLYVRQHASNVGSEGLLVLVSFCMLFILSLYENCVTSELVVPPPKFEHNLSSLLMSIESKVIGFGPKEELEDLIVETEKWNISYAKDQFESNNDLHQQALPIVNGTSISYFGFYSAVESELRLRGLRLINNKCHCYIIKHTIRSRAEYIVLRHFLRHKLASISNILRESGIISFLTAEYRKHGFSITLAKLKRGLEENNYHSDFFVREETRMDVIKLENLYFTFVILGGMGLLAGIIFTLKQMDWSALFVYLRSILSTHLLAISYVKLVHRLCAFRLVRIRARKANL